MGKILVTGGAGFIGSRTIRKLLDLNYDVVCVDNFNNYYDPKIKERNISQFKKERRFSLYKQDICDLRGLNKIFKNEKPEKVCHLAAQVGVRASLKNPHLYIETNIGGTLNLLQLSVATGVEGFVFASSSSVYGHSKKIPFSEDDPTDKPVSPYATSKKAAELLIYTYHCLHNLNCTILRFFTVYGPSGRPDMAPFLFVDSIFKGKTLKKFGRGDSERDYTYIDDLVDGIVMAIKQDFPFEIINLGNDHPIELNYLINLIERILKKKAIIGKFARQPGDVNVTWANITKARKLLGYRPKVSIEEGMEKFITWYLNNRKEEKGVL